MSVSLCIHGHFYQPPREDPWLGRILGEASAAPMRHWNERILRESYAPLGFARRLDSQGRIADILNCYEWMSFNAGPTLVQWMRRAAPTTLARMREGDAISRARWGFGNALAQVYHHVIMPLATAEDRALEARWAVDDFRSLFGRAPEGMWLSECAVDIPSLESLAAEGIRFVILAPRQAKAVQALADAGVSSSAPSSPSFLPVDEGGLNIGEPYQVALPSGSPMSVVFYHGGLSQSIAFDGLLRDGEAFWRRIAGESGSLAARNPGNSLLTLATDGETYGHHFTFGEMALAHVLSQGYARRDGLGLTNIAAYIDKHPPVRRVVLHEPSSWSCVHGVERWRSDCGCKDGGHQDWSQRWRGPLREALQVMRTDVTAHFAEAGKACFTDAGAALLEYGAVLADPGKGGDFARSWFRTGAGDKAWKLLAMREQALAAFASCAWFFDDISRIEPENGLTFALRAMELCVDTGGPDSSGAVMRVLEKAVSNRPEMGTGKDIFQAEVLPRRDGPAALCLLAALLLESEGRMPGVGGSAVYRFPLLSVELRPEGIRMLRSLNDFTTAAPAAEASARETGRDAAHARDAGAPEGRNSSAPEESGLPREWRGTAVIRTSLEEAGTRYSWRWLAPGRAEDAGGVFVPLAQSAMTARREAAPPENTAALPLAAAALSDAFTHSTVAELARPMRDFLLPLLLENREALLHERMRTDAVHALSLSDAWVEAQREAPRPELWHGLLPYVALAGMQDESLGGERLDGVVALLSSHLGAGGEVLAAQIIERAFLRELAQQGVPGDMDARLASQARRVRRLLPEMDWWAVQNALWERGPQSLPLLAEAIGFLIP